MTQFISNPPYAQQARAERAAAAAQQQQAQSSRRNNRKSYQQVDGAVSDGAIMNNASSPRPRRNNKQRQAAATAQQPEGNMGRGDASRARPVSYAGAHVPDTPAKEQAYAGPTFQASPAASALPMPKFSKSVPNAGMRGSMSARLAAEKAPSSDVEQSDQSSPEADVVAPAVPRREESPLDLFFKADREEKEKSRSGSQTLSPATANNYQAPATMPRNPFQQSNRNALLNELDGDSDNMPSPRTVPHNGRPQLGHRATSSPGTSGRQDDENAGDRQANTQNLRNLLFQTAATATTGTPPTKSRAQHSSQTPPAAVYGSPSPVQGYSSGAVTPQPTTEQQQHQDHYALHYGNRNLSPLFKAARDTPARSSSLRQEVASDTSSESGAGVPLYGLESPHFSARNYFSPTAHTAGPVPRPNHPSGGTSFNGVPVFPNHEANGAGIPNEPRAHDVTAMENDLRRLLKLNVLG